jgi:hypothetical protein
MWLNLVSVGDINRTYLLVLVNIVLHENGIFEHNTVLEMWAGTA